MRLNYSRSPELYLNFLRSNFSDLPGIDAAPVSATASLDTLAALSRRNCLVPPAMTPVVKGKHLINSRS